MLAFLAEAPRFARLPLRLHRLRVGHGHRCLPGERPRRRPELQNHYEETKYLAEVDVVRSGLKASIYRPSDRGGGLAHRRDGGSSTGPYFTLSAMGGSPSPGLFLRVGSGKNLANLVPVDFIVEALARCSARPEPGRGPIT